MFERILWALFGETRIIYALAIIEILMVLGVLFGTGYVVHHFIVKYW